MNYSQILTNDFDTEEVKIEFTNFTDLVVKTILQKKIWHVKKNHYPFDPPDFKYHKDLINKIAENWNNTFEKNRLEIKTFLINFDITEITKYWDITFENFIVSNNLQNTFEKIEYPIKPPTATEELNIHPPPRVENYLFEAKNKITLLDKLLRSRRTKILNDATIMYQTAFETWSFKKEEIEKANQKAQIEDEKRISTYLKNKSEFEREQDERYQKWRSQYEKAKEDYQNRKTKLDANDPKEVVEYIEGLLLKISFPIVFKHKIETDYIQETKSLVVNYLLPNIEDMDLIKEIKPNFAQNKIIEKPLSKKEIDEFYDYLIYSICLQSLRYIYKSEAFDVIQSIIFNGWIESIDKATGNDYRACILSVHATKEAIDNINFAKVNPIECFKSIRGVSGSKLTNLSPVAPILDIDKKDKRFVASQDVLKEVDTSTNLAAMGWEDFEHLIREIFEKEFSQNGGEVKITQASRDGGVDAIAFDPDPIRGGKIVIQAKRYTNVVGVSAVRDLFGTLMNEGATKGILVTTSNYGSDAYEFAKGKPITLLTGANLLSLLGKHGVKAKIDIREAKKILKEQDME